MNRYTRLDNQAPAVEQMEANNVNVGRSAHDCSHIHNGNTLIGALTPVLCMEVVLNEDIDINLASLIEFRNPTTRQLFNSFRVYFHGYFNSLTDAWEGAKNWLDKGRSGKIDLSRPNLIYKVETDSYAVNAVTPMSLLNFLGLPVEAYQTTVTDSSGVSSNRSPLRQFQSAFATLDSELFEFDKIGESTDYFPADCVFVYQKNWRDFYANKNLLQNNKFWFPDNEDHFILSYSCGNAVCINYENESLSNTATSQINNLTGGQLTANSLAYLNITPEPNNPVTARDNSQYIQDIYAPNLSGLKFRQFRGDRFTTASPFPDLIRGELPILQLTEDNYVQFAYTNPSSSQISAPIPVNGKASGTFTGNAGIISGLHSSSFGISSTSSTDARNSLIVPESTVTMSDIYTLETLTAFKRKMGMTNGDYSEMMEAQFGVKPKVHNRRGTYIGGFYQDFAFSSVTQTSESTSEGTPLGTKAGQGISSGSGRIGHIHTTDFGWIQVYMSIMPDVYYTQGKPRQFSKRSNLEMYFPIFNNLPAQAIRNDELFVSGDPTTDSSPFAYEDRYAEFKSIQNRVSGLMGLPVSLAEFDTARVIARRFSSTPALNSLFVTAVPENIDMSVFSVYDEPPFDFSIGFSIRRVFPGPYAAVEGSLSSPKLNV